MVGSLHISAQLAPEIGAATVLEFAWVLGSGSRVVPVHVSVREVVFGYSGSRSSLLRNPGKIRGTVSYRDSRSGNGGALLSEFADLSPAEGLSRVGTQSTSFPRFLEVTERESPSL